MKIAAIAAASLVALSACGEKSSSEVPSIPAAIAPPPAPPAPLVSAAPRPKPSDGPFGVRMGMPLSELEALAGPLQTKDGFSYLGSTAPTPHSRFTTYRFLVAEGVGLCGVKGATESIPSNVFGEGITDAFAEISEPLQEKYGKPSFAFDYVQRGSLWREPQDWMMGLLKEDRTLRSSWFKGEFKELKGKNPANLPATLNSIVLKAVAYDMAAGYLVIDYSFENNDECVALANKATNKPL